MSNIELSIIIVNFNTFELTLGAISSVYKTKPKVNFEVIVVDNFSTDTSREKLPKLTKAYRSLKVILNDENLGFAKANNIGINSARGEYILLLNSDTKVKGKAIDSLYNFAKGNKIGAVGAKLLNANGTTQPSAFNFPTIGRAIRQYWLGEKGLFDKYTPGGYSPSKVDALVMAAFLISPKALEVVGGLDEKYFMYFEDFDYCRRLSEASLPVYYLPEAEVVHYHGSSGKKIAKADDQWRRLIPSSKLYHGVITHSLITFIMWTSQKWRKLFA